MSGAEKCVNPKCADYGFIHSGMCEVLPEGAMQLPQWLIGDARKVRTVEEVLTLVRDIVTEDGRFFVLMAKHLQISQKHLSQIMVGNAKLSAQRMFDILDYLGRDVWVERREPPK